MHEYMPKAHMEWLTVCRYSFICKQPTVNITNVSWLYKYKEIVSFITRVESQISPERQGVDWNK